MMIEWSFNMGVLGIFVAIVTTALVPDILQIPYTQFALNFISVYDSMTTTGVFFSEQDSDEFRQFTAMLPIIALASLSLFAMAFSLLIKILIFIPMHLLIFDLYGYVFPPFWNFVYPRTDNVIVFITKITDYFEVNYNGPIENLSFLNITKYIQLREQLEGIYEFKIDQDCTWYGLGACWIQYSKDIQNIII